MKYMTNEKMKKLLFISFLIIGSLVMSCSQREAPDILEKVERYIDICPDSALLLLNQLPHPEKLHGKQRADYALLLTQARDKNYLDSLQSDSLIKIAVDYYQDSEDQVKKGKALFYYGKVMAVKDEPTVAMQAYLDAQTVLENTKEYKVQALLQEYIGYLNFDRYMYNVAVDSYLKSISYSKKAQDTMKIVYGYRNIARVYITTENYDSACWYANYGIAMLKDESVKPVLPSLLQVLGLAERSRGNYSTAIDYFIQAINLEKDIYTIDHYYLSLGSIYTQTAEFEKARACFEKALTSKQVFTQAGAYNNLFQLEKKRKNYASALYYKEKSDSLLNITQDEDLRTQILSLQRKYESDKLIMEKRQLEQEKETQLYFLLFIILLLVTVGGTAFLFLKRVYKKRYIKNLYIIKQNEKTINEYIYQVEDLKRKESLALESNKEKIGKLNQRILLLANENKEIRENICVNAVFLLDQLKKCTLIVRRMNKKEKSQIFEYMDLLFGNYISRLRVEYELTENNVMLAALLKVGFTSKELMLVFDCEMNSVFRMKQRLKERLRLSNEKNLEEFIALY